MKWRIKDGNAASAEPNAAAITPTNENAPKTVVRL